MDNYKNIIEIKDSETDIKYGYSNYKGLHSKYFFINIENVPVGGIICYTIFEPYNPLGYRKAIKYYDNYNISELPKAAYIHDLEDEDDWDLSFEFDPVIFIRKRKEAKGLFLKAMIDLPTYNDSTIHNDMTIYLYAKKMFEITENQTINYTQLLQKNSFLLPYELKRKETNVIMKSNLDYFTMLYPIRQKVKAKGYFYEIYHNFFMIEFPISEKASIEIKLVDSKKINQLINPNMLFLCDNDNEEEKYINLPYMTKFSILYGDVEIYDINIASLNSLDDLFNEAFMKKYNYDERYYDYSSFKEEQFIYKLKCKKNSLIKYEDTFIPTIDENIIFNDDSKKLILDFSQYEQKVITFESNPTIYIGFLNSQELNEDCILHFSINDIAYSIKYGETFSPRS